MEQTDSKRSIIAEYYSLHYDELKAFVAARLQNEAESEDIVQNVFMRLLRSDKLVAPVTLPCLVYTIAKNLISDYWRHRRNVEQYEHVVMRADWMSRCHNDVETVYSISEITAILERGIARLDEKQRRVYRMNFYEDKQVSEIARELALNYKNTENRLGMARKSVRQYVKRMLA